MRRQRLDARHVVGGAVDRVLVGADVDADDPGQPGARREPRRDHGRALAVEAEPVDHAFVRVEAEQARTRIARLRQRRHAAGFDEAEAETKQRVRHLGVLVEARRKPDRIGKRQAERLHAQLRVVRRGPRQRHELSAH